MTWPDLDSGEGLNFAAELGICAECCRDMLYLLCWPMKFAFGHLPPTFCEKFLNSSQKWIIACLSNFLAGTRHSREVPRGIRFKYYYNILRVLIPQNWVGIGHLDFYIFGRNRGHRFFGGIVLDFSRCFWAELLVSTLNLPLGIWLTLILHAS